MTLQIISIENAAIGLISILFVIALFLLLSGGNALHRKGKEWDEHIEGGGKLNDINFLTNK